MYRLTKGWMERFLEWDALLWGQQREFNGFYNQFLMRPQYRNYSFRELLVVPWWQRIRPTNYFHFVEYPYWDIHHLRYGTPSKWLENKERMKRSRTLNGIQSNGNYHSNIVTSSMKHFHRCLLGLPKFCYRQFRGTSSGMQQPTVLTPRQKHTKRKTGPRRSRRAMKN